MKYGALTIFLLAALSLCAEAHSAVPDFNNLTPHASGGSTKISGKVSTSDDGTIRAEDIQSGVNSALKKILGNEDGRELYQIAVPSGFATIAAATRAYRTYDVLDATLLSKRAAYITAYQKAQQRILSHLEGLTSFCENQSVETTESVTGGATETRANVSRKTHERCQETAKGMVRGLVVFAVQDDAPRKTVTVAVASSNATVSGPQSLGNSVVSAQDPEKAWNALMEKLKAGVLPPAGARLIDNPDKDEQTAVAFGSAIVPQNADSFIARKLRRTAQRNAQTRANNALVGFMQGSEVYWKGGFETNQVQEARQFDSNIMDEYEQARDQISKTADALANIARSYREGGVAAAADTTSKEVEKVGDHNKPDVTAYQKTKNSFLSYVKRKDLMRTTTKGRLPPGIRQQSFMGSDGHWAYAVTVYSAAATDRAQGLAKQMQSGNDDDRYGRDTSAKDEDEFNSEGGANPNAKNPKGPSGQVTPASDL